MGVRELRLYSNRRLYDTSVSQYVTFDDLLELVRRGVAIRVVDSSTGEDHTLEVLLDVLLREERRSGTDEPILTHGFLHELIRAGAGPHRTATREFLDLCANELSVLARNQRRTFA